MPPFPVCIECRNSDDAADVFAFHGTIQPISEVHEAGENLEKEFLGIRGLGGVLEHVSPFWVVLNS